MTSKEALEKLVSKTSILNDTCASLKNCIKTKKCRFNEPCETCDDYNLFKIIQQDLDQLENIKKDLQYMQDKGVQQFISPDGTIILGFDITNSPYQQEIRKEILEDIINNMCGVFENETNN